MKKLILTVMTLLSATFAFADEAAVSSPDGKLQVSISCNGGRAFYSATFNGQQVLCPSALGLKTSIGDFTMWFGHFLAGCP